MTLKKKILIGYGIAFTRDGTGGRLGGFKPGVFGPGE